MKVFINTFTQAVEALGDHRLRTFLSILGITIGISAVMVVSTISRGGNHVVFSELETFGLNSVWLSRDWNAESATSQLNVSSGIHTSDLEEIKQQKEMLGIRRVTPLMSPTRSADGQISRGDKLLRADLIGVNESYTGIVNDSIARGRGLMRHDVEKRQPVAIIAPGAVQRLFDEGEDPLGQVIYMNNQRLVVVGILSEISRDFLSSIGSAGDANLRVLIPYTYMQRLVGNDDVDRLQLEVKNFEDAEHIGAQVQILLNQRHKNFVYGYSTMAPHIETTNRILGGVAIVGIIAASISLLVGGMGIMNMMSTAVLERTREIGVRKAIGAREKDIMTQFLLEAGLISIAGGFLGLIFGGLTSVIFAYATGFPILPSYTAIFGAIAVSIAVGMVSGYLPARRAALMHPVEALRSD